MATTFTRLAFFDCSTVTADPFRELEDTNYILNASVLLILSESIMKSL